MALQICVCTLYQYDVSFGGYLCYLTCLCFDIWSSQRCGATAESKAVKEAAPGISCCRNKTEGLTGIFGGIWELLGSLLAF